ncbi:MAG: hypothetical protein HY787_25245 [Deltaproteobacteria bacterium]|nr:hypothetical protein [Deltaproteobacteria bacterium]
MNGKEEPLNTTVSVKLESEVFTRFMKFVFRTEISKSAALHMGIEILGPGLAQLVDSQRGLLQGYGLGQGKVDLLDRVELVKDLGNLGVGILECPYCYRIWEVEYHLKMWEKYRLNR